MVYCGVQNRFQSDGGESISWGYGEEMGGLRVSTTKCLLFLLVYVIKRLLVDFLLNFRPAYILHS